MFTSAGLSILLSPYHDWKCLEITFHRHITSATKVWAHFTTTWWFATALPRVGNFYKGLKISDRNREAELVLPGLRRHRCWPLLVLTSCLRQRVRYKLAKTQLSGNQIRSYSACWGGNYLSGFWCLRRDWRERPAAPVRGGTSHMVCQITNHQD